MSRHELMKLVPAKPSLMDRIRSITLGPFNSKDKALASLFGGGPTTSGVHVSSSNVLSYSAVWSAVTMVSDDIASLPLHLYRNTDTAAGKGKERFRDHPLYELLHDTPNPEMDAMTMIKTMQGHRMVYQNAYAEIVRDGAGRPREIWPLVPERVAIERDRGGRLVYRVSNQNGGDVFIGPEDIIHLVGQSHDGMRGCELVERARESFALGLAAEKFGGAFFGNGATMQGVISYPAAKPADKIVKNTQEAIDARHQGVERAHKLLALYNGAKYERMGVNPNEGQFNETRVFQIREVARWFKIPPHKLGDLADATYSNVEQMQAAYLESCIRPYLKEWQQQLSRKLISRLERRQQFFEFDTHGFMSVDATSRAELYQAETHVGSVTINEIRSYENRNPVEGGDVPFVQLQSIPLDLARPYWEASIKGMLAKAEKDQRPTPAPQPPPQDMEADRKLLEFVERVHPELTKEIADLRAQLEDVKQSCRVADQRANELSSAHAEAEEQRDAARAELAQSLEIQRGLETTLAEERAESNRAIHALDHQVESLGATEASLRGDVARLMAELSASAADNGALIVERDAADANAEAARAEVLQWADTAAQANMAKEKAEEELREITASFSASLGRVLATENERDAEKARADTAEAIRESQTERISALESELMFAEAAKQAAVEAQLNAERVQADTVQLLEKAAQQRDDAKALTDGLLAAKEQAIGDLADLAGENEMLRQAAKSAQADALKAEADKVAAEQRAEAAERDKVIAEQAQQAANALIESRRQAEAKRMLDVIAAHRALMVQTMKRVLAKETDRARRHQATPQKLRAWMETYYQSEVDDIAEALLPIVRAHLAWMQSGQDPATVAEEMAREHVEASQQQLRSVMAVEDWNQALAMTLTRWEDKRPDAVADAFIREGLAYVRSL